MKLRGVVTGAVILIIGIVVGHLFLFKETPVRLALHEGVMERAEAAFKAAACANDPRTLNESYYRGPMIDTHVHIAPIPDGPALDLDYDEIRPVLGHNIHIEDYRCMLIYENTSKAFAFFPVWDPFTEQFLAVVNMTLMKYDGMFVPFIMPPQHDDDANGYPTVNATELSAMLATHPGMFAGYGEIGLYAREGGAAALPPDSVRLREIYPLVREQNLIVYFHLGEGQQESFERMLDENPDITFIWHGDQLIEYRDGVQHLEKVEEILARHPNAYYGVDELYGDVWLLRPEVRKEEFLAHFTNASILLEKDLATWQGFIRRHQDQVLWGTDRGWSAPWSTDPDVALVLNTYTRAFISRLDPEVQEKFAYKNAQKILERTGR